MIINIPLQVDEKQLEDVIARDYDSKIMQEIVKRIEATLVDQSHKYYGKNRATDGMTNLIRDRIDKYLEEHKDEVIEAAGNALAEKLVRTKRGKALLEEANAETT